MKTLRQGTAKRILESSIDSALLAVETYNRPRVKFRIENFIVLMIIAWTKAFHAYFYICIGDKFYYKEKNGRYKKIGNDKKAWELKECIKQYNKINRTNPLLQAIVSNLDFFIELRNKIEHRNIDNSLIDITIFGQCQALLYNYENFLIENFGESYALNSCLSYSLQFSQLRNNSQLSAQRNILTRDAKYFEKFINSYNNKLPQEIFDSQEYSIKLIQIPKISNTNRADLAIDFVKWDNLSRNDKDKFNKITALIKDKKVKVPVSNHNYMKPSTVAEKVKIDLDIDFKTYHNTYLWKAFEIRPESNAEDKTLTKEKYCLYDEPHNDYLYSDEWVKLIIILFSNYDFTIDNIKDKCKNKLNVEDYIED